MEWYMPTHCQEKKQVHDERRDGKNDAPCRRHVVDGARLTYSLLYY